MVRENPPQIYKFLLKGKIPLPFQVVWMYIGGRSYELRILYFAHQPSLGGRNGCTDRIW